MLTSPANLKTHQFTERPVHDAIRQVVFGAAEATQLVLWNVDAVASGVLLDVAEDVGQLHGETEVDGVGLDLRVLIVAEYPDAHQPDHRGYLVAIFTEVVEGLIPRDVEVHLHTGDDLIEVLPGYSELGSRVAERRIDRLFISALSRLSKRRADAAETFESLYTGQVLVGYVVAETAEGVGGVDGATLDGRQGPEGVVEVLCFGLGYPLAKIIGGIQIGLSRCHTDLRSRCGHRRPRSNTPCKRCMFSIRTRTLRDRLASCYHIEAALTSRPGTQRS